MMKRGNCSKGSRNLMKSNKKNDCFSGKCVQVSANIQGCGCGVLNGGMGMSQLFPEDIV
ncbi:rCG22939 [Rattus norvegicus]|uniref:RCG22939 n=1 Tax=Rattus norvegicus TaxID=10116 RepID=A6KBB1_RAT|nr:rCG22939 [Rattus norvegicus]